jgi:hypothetical protein
MTDRARLIQALMGADQFSDFRASDNIEDRRKEKFNSFPQAQQMPNVFGDPLTGYDHGLLNLKRDDFMPQPAQPGQLSNNAGAGNLDELIRLYLAARQ